MQCDARSTWAEVAADGAAAAAPMAAVVVPQLLQWWDVTGLPQRQKHSAEPPRRMPQSWPPLRLRVEWVLRLRGPRWAVGPAAAVP